MAVKWAVADGNWNAGATWNGGAIPTADDDVYLNGHNISLDLNATITCKSISNIANNDYYIISGGKLVSTSNNSVLLINANIYAKSYGIVDCTFMTNGLLTLVGNIFCEDLFGGESLLRRKNASVNRFSISVNGNIDITGTGTLFDGNTSNSTEFGININGNVNLGDNVVFMKGWSSTPFGPLVINGNLSVGKNVGTLIGNVTITGTSVMLTTIHCYVLTIGDSITYESHNVGDIGFTYTTLNILNPDTFTWKDVTEPRSNPFIILTDAEMNNRQQYPSEDAVKQGVEYVWGQKVGTYLPDYPPESVVLQGYEYDNGDMVGNMAMVAQVGCVTKEDVREGVPLLGMGEVGSLVVPSVDDVREGVVFDNGSVGTLIVQGGGDRLRIADFGYYTRSTSITYIVDLTESDKPAFADCEEIVLRSLFPTLDLDNIPDKFFDDLFVQFLRYRLLVEYYRGTSINSKFTPSEPAAEIVNYANTKCEYWLNTANLFLQLWGEKYPNSVKKDRILL